jgi:hypothetical protein
MRASVAAGGDGKDFFVTPTYVLLTYVAGSPSTGKDIVPRAHTSHTYVAGSPSTGDKESTQLTPAVLQGMHRYMGFFVTVTVVNSSIAEQLYSRIPC